MFCSYTCRADKNGAIRTSKCIFMFVQWTWNFWCCLCEVNYFQIRNWVRFRRRNFVVGNFTLMTIYCFTFKTVQSSFLFAQNTFFNGRLCLKEKRNRTELSKFIINLKITTVLYLIIKWKLQYTFTASNKNMWSSRFYASIQCSRFFSRDWICVYIKLSLCPTSMFNSF